MGSKQHHLSTPRDGEPLSFAGVWGRCKTIDAGNVASLTIVTQPAGAPLNGYHDRVPVVIWPQDRERWLKTGEPVDDLMEPASADRFDAADIFQAEEASWAATERAV